MLKYLSPLKASATMGIALIVSYVQVRHATIQANGTLENVDQSESMFKFRGEFYFLTKSGRQFQSGLIIVSLPNDQPLSTAAIL